MTDYFKYPRTPHLPWSEGRSDDDGVLENDDIFIGKQVVVSEKMDGENQNLYQDHIHARSIESKDHPSRHWVKGMWSGISHQIPEGWRICGENLFAKHSIHYQDLESYFQVFSVWNEKNICLDWFSTCVFARHLGLKVVPMIWSGKYDKRDICDFFATYRNNRDIEGYVIRLSDEFHYDDFDKSVAKFVRKNHVQTDEHWMNQKMVPNQLKK
jgi:hypothetical protein